jgi:hypothetical protein
MPFLIVIAAGYQAYAASEKAKEAAYDPDINLEGKTAITLLKMEQQLSSMEMPLSSVTFFDGNYKDVVPYLESRVKEIDMTTSTSRFFTMKRVQTEIREPSKLTNLIMFRSCVIHRNICILRGN